MSAENEDGASQESGTVPTVFVEPGFVIMPEAPSRLCSVVASGVVVTLYDRTRHCGGAANYVFPRRLPDVPETPLFACPAIVGLSRLLLSAGSRECDLEARLYGGAVNPDSPRFMAGQSEDNVHVAEQILNTLQIEICGQETGGRRGRKIVFHCGTGEIVLASVDTIRSADWYPTIQSLEA